MRSVSIGPMAGQIRQSYDLQYQLNSILGWNGAPVTVDLSHTLIAGAVSGDGLRSVVSQNEGTLARQSDGSFGYAAALATSEAPEPASWAMMIGGFAMIGGTLRRRGTPRAA